MDLLIGTDDGLFAWSAGRATRLRSGKVSHVSAAGSGVWIIVDDRLAQLVDGQWQALPEPDRLKPRCVLPLADGALVGTSEAQLFRVRGGTLEQVAGFANAPGRLEWHTPWGGPPDTRSLAQDAGGAIYANVHVGGVLRSADGADWRPTMDIGADVHQVNAHPTIVGCVLVASAWGLGLSFDGGLNWQFTRQGLPRSYCRAVAASGETILISASDGPGGGRAAVYRRGLRDDAAFERCSTDPPDWFAGNIDSGCLVATGSQVAFGTADGRLFVSDDAGETWSLGAEGLPAVRGLSLAQPA